MTAPKLGGGSKGCKRDGYAAYGESGRVGGEGGLDLWSVISTVSSRPVSVGGTSVRPAVACVTCVVSSSVPVMMMSSCDGVSMAISMCEEEECLLCGSAGEDMLMYRECRSGD